MAVAPEVPDRSGGSKRLLVSARPSYGGDAIVADGRAPGGKFGGKNIFSCMWLPRWCPSRWSDCVSPSHQRKKERKHTTQGRDGRTARRHHTGILRRGVWCASRRPPWGVCLFVSLFAVSRRFSLQPSCHLAVVPLSSPVLCEGGCHSFFSRLATIMTKILFLAARYPPGSAPA